MIDFDESDELDRAITFICETSRKMAGERRDYTEVIYATKDNIQIRLLPRPSWETEGFRQFLSWRQFFHRC